MQRLGLLLSVAGLVLACGSTPEAEAPRPPKAKRGAVQRVKAEPETFIPKRCARRKGECMPPPRWVQRLCDGIYPDVALHMFRPGTPWQRMYMVVRAEPFNASGGMSLLGEKLERHEEVIALRRRRNDGEFQAGDNAGYDVLRWNGACATIHDGDFTKQMPVTRSYAPFEWRRLSLELRLALEAQPPIARTYEARRKACNGRSMGRVAAECEEYDKKLMDEVVSYVRSGAKLPKPGKVP